MADRASIVDRVYSALVRLHADTGRPANKAATHRALNDSDVSLAQVYEALRSLRAACRVDSPAHGLFQPAAEIVQDRAFSLTDLPSGRTKFEIGEHLIEFSPGEMARMGPYFAGHAKAAA